MVQYPVTPPSNPSQTQLPTVRGRCACGSRYRIRNAAPGRVVNCPQCGRAITITDADIRAALSGTTLTPVQATGLEIPEARLMEAGELQPAPRGSRVGRLGKTTFANPDAAVVFALGGMSYSAPTPVATPGRPRPMYTEPQEPPPRHFLLDLLASFYFAGVWRNAWIVLATAAGATVTGLFFFILPPPAGLLGLFALIFLLMFTVSFSWNVLKLTADDEDEMLMGHGDWALWDDVVIPLFFVALITVGCLVPAVLVEWFIDDAKTWKEPVVWAALIVGSFFWPISVMSAALGNSVWFLRPDWLVRSILGIGPAYVAVWLMVAAVFIGSSYALAYLALRQLVSSFFLGSLDPVLWVQQLVGPVLGAVALLYFSYVLFRTIGLLHRHYRHRLPWKF